MSKDAHFTGEGFDSFPSLYHDEQRLQNVMNWPSNQLADKVREYAHFLRQPDNMPRAQQTAQRIFNRLAFEVGQREGMHHSVLKDLDELCEGNM